MTLKISKKAKVINIPPLLTIEESSNYQFIK